MTWKTDVVGAAAKLAHGAVLATTTVAAYTHVPAFAAIADKVVALVKTGLFFAGTGISAGVSYATGTVAKLATLSFIKYSVLAAAHPIAAPAVAVAIGVAASAVLAFGLYKGIQYTRTHLTVSSFTWAAMLPVRAGRFVTGM